MNKSSQADTNSTLIDAISTGFPQKAKQLSPFIWDVNIQDTPLICFASEHLTTSANQIWAH